NGPAATAPPAKPLPRPGFDAVGVSSWFRAQLPVSFAAISRAPAPCAAGRETIASSGIVAIAGFPPRNRVFADRRVMCAPRSERSLILPRFQSRIGVDHPRAPEVSKDGLCGLFRAQARRIDPDFRRFGFLVRRIDAREVLQLAASGFLVQ